MLKRFVAIAALASLSGCASLSPLEHRDTAPVTEAKAAQFAAMSEAWDKTPVLTEGKASVVLLTPQTIPAEIRQRRVTMELEPQATVEDVVAILGKLGIATILSDEEAAKRTFFLPRFNGTVGGLLSAVTRATDTWFTWHDGTVVVSSTEKIGVSVPQEEKFAEDLTKGLESLGIKEKSVHWQSGMAVMSVSPRQFAKTRTFLERYTANAAVVSLQVAIVNVTLNQSAKQGIDWERLQLAATSGGTVAQLNTALKALNAGTEGVSSTAGAVADTAAGAASAAALPSILGGSLTGGAVTGALISNRFSFQGLFNFLSSYGVAETKQNVMLKTTGGTKVEFKSLMQIPYVSEVGVTNTSNTANGSSSTGSTSTAKADDGITVEMTPTYDAAANSVTINLSLSIKAVVAFNELSAGNQIGKLTQPTTAERSFTDTLRLRPGQTVVVGGLTYDSVSDNRSSPLFLSGSRLESQSLVVNRQTMFIVVRPTVSRLGQVLFREAAPELALLPMGAYAPEPVDAEAAASKQTEKRAARTKKRADARTPAKAVRGAD